MKLRLSENYPAMVMTIVQAEKSAIVATKKYRQKNPNSDPKSFHSSLYASRLLYSLLFSPR
jgi:hypothetical protein